MRMRAAASVIAATKRSCSDRCTSSRDPATQDWPAPAKIACCAPCTAAAKSASSNTMLADLPPSSSTQGMVRAAQAAATAAPAGGPPTKVTRATSGAASSAAPVPCPGPQTTCTRPRGSPASMHSSPRASEVSGVNSDGFSTTALPAARAGNTFQPAVNSGAFHGVTASTTP